MSSSPPGVPEETRAEIARRRLADLAAAFDARWQPADTVVADEQEVGQPRHRRRWSDRHVAVLAILGLAAAVLIAWWVVAGRPGEVEGSAAVEVPEQAEASSAPQDLVVHVAGDVAQPGIVVVPAGSRVHEAIDAAGGLVGDPDLASLNLARELDDGEQVLVGAAPAADPPSSPGGGRVPLNSADRSALEELPGIGPVTAQAIIDRRNEHGPFRAVEDLLDVKGIGEATLAELRDHVVV